MLVFLWFSFFRFSDPKTFFIWTLHLISVSWSLGTYGTTVCVCVCVCLIERWRGQIGAEFRFSGSFDTKISTLKRERFYRMDGGMVVLCVYAFYVDDVAEMRCRCDARIVWSHLIVAHMPWSFEEYVDIVKIADAFRFLCVCVFILDSISFGLVYSINVCGCLRCVYFCVFLYMHV